MMILQLWCKVCGLCLLMYQAWTLSVEMILPTNNSGSCLQPMVCRERYRSWSLSVIIAPNNTFALGKSAKSVEGKIVLISSVFMDGHDSYKDINMCTINCSRFFLEHKTLFLQRVPNSIKINQQLVFDSLNSGGQKLEYIAQTVNIILAREKWKTTIIFAPSQKELTALSSRITSDIGLLLYTVNGGLQVNNTLERIYSRLKTKDLNFITTCSSLCIEEFFHQAEQQEAKTGKTSRWLVIPAVGSIDDFMIPSKSLLKADIVVIDLVNFTDGYTPFDLDAFRTLLPSLKYKLNSTTLDSTHNNELSTYIEEKLTHNNSLVIADVYALHARESDRNIKHVGRISRNRDLEVTNDLFPGWKYGLYNKTLTVSTLEWHPFVFKKEENGSVKYSGFCIDLIDDISRALNFSYKIVEPEDQEWGRVLDGKWTGLVGDLAYKKVDLVVAALGISEERENVMDFSTPYYYEQSAIMLKVPDATKWMTLVAPFRYEVHICILFSLIFSTTILFVVEEIHPVNTWTNNSLSARRTRYGDILWYHFGALMANGGAHLPNSQSGRSVLSCWWLFTVISAAIYSGNLVAFLTDWRENLPFTSLEEMAQQNTYEWGILGGSLYTTHFQNSSRPVYKRIWQVLESDPDATELDMDVHKRKLLAGNYAFLGDTAIMDIWRSEHCDLRRINDRYLSMNFGIGLQNNSAYTSLFTEQVLRITELGLARIWYQRHSPHVGCETSRSAKRVDLLALQSAFYAAGAGVFLALSVVFVEVMYNRKCKQFLSPIADDNSDENQTK